MSFKESNKKIYVTTDYDMFKILENNRSVETARVIKTMESISNFGWMTEPILVNERYEVIDGQGRLEALKRLGMPVEFVIDKGVGIKECRALNVYQKNWTTMDYIDSYVADGNDDYIWLKNTINKHSDIPTYIALAVAAEGTPTNTRTRISGTDMIKTGRLHRTKEEREDAETALFYLSRFVDAARVIGGHKDNFFSAILFLYRLEAVDNERLCKSVNEARYSIKGQTTGTFIMAIEDVYNKNLAKSNRIDMLHEFKKTA